MEYREFNKEELKWISSFQKVMGKAPKSLFFFVGAGNTIFPKDENGNRYLKDNGSVDGDCPAIYVSTPMECDGGDY